MLFHNLKAAAFLVGSASARLTCRDETISKDVVIVGGGASGAYAAFRLREDFGKSVTLIEKESILGGHVDSYTDPKSNITYDSGVVTFIDSGNATGFLERLGLGTAPLPRAEVVTGYYDFETGDEVDFNPPPFPEQLGKLADFIVEAEKYEPLIQGPGYFNFPEPEDIPEDLLIPFGEFLEKHDIVEAMPFIYQTTALGVGNVTNELTLFALQAFGASMARSTTGLQDSFVPDTFRNQDIYDRIGDVLGDDVMYNSVVADTDRTEDGVTVQVKDLETGHIKTIEAKRLLIAIAPTMSNLGPFNLDEEEEEILSKLEYNNLYTGIIDNENLVEGYSYFNMPSSSAPDNVLVLPEASFNARIDHMGSGHIFRVTVIGDGELTPQGCKELVQKDFDTLIEAGVIKSAENNEVSWVDFSVHGPMHARVSLEEVKSGFFQRYNALQGGRSTWFTGGAWAVNFQTHLWEYDDIIIPMMLKGLDD